MFRAKKGTGDYRQEMISKRFEVWFIQKLFPNIKVHDVIVMDNAAYQSQVSHHYEQQLTERECARLALDT